MEKLVIEISKEKDFSEMKNSNANTVKTDLPFWFSKPISNFHGVIFDGDDMIEASYNFGPTNYVKRTTIKTHDSYTLQPSHGQIIAKL